uniref:BOD1/SHG1 domain-containing protein n=1 Tax=Chrysemys picta bellii TaxID=8478 RepID=A0A8C3FEE8_CHRPI
MQCAGGEGWNGVERGGVWAEAEPEAEPGPPLPGASGGGGAVEPELVSVIVNHLKSQGLFDQFRRDCLADVDTKVWDLFKVACGNTFPYI